MVQQDKFTYSPLGKACEKQTKRIEDQGKNKQKKLKSMENILRHFDG